MEVTILTEAVESKNERTALPSFTRRSGRKGSDNQKNLNTPQAPSPITQIKTRQNTNNKKKDTKAPCVHVLSSWTGDDVTTDISALWLTTDASLCCGGQATLHIFQFTTSCSFCVSLAGNAWRDNIQFLPCFHSYDWRGYHLRIGDWVLFRVSRKKLFLSAQNGPLIRRCIRSLAFRDSANLKGAFADRCACCIRASEADS